jgi:glycosyltransferase involved in cell wall biosynthesis
VCKPRVLTVVRPVQGGIEAHIRNLLVHLRGHFDFTLACPPEQVSRFSGLCPVAPLPIGGGLHPARDLHSLWKLHRMLQAGRYQLVHAHGFKAATLARLPARANGVPCLVTVHGDLAHGAGGRLAVFYRGLERHFAPWTSGYITVSAWLARLLEDSFAVPGERISVIPNGIAAGFSGSSGDDGLPFDGPAPVVGTVARLAPQKGVAYFLQAAAQVSRQMPEARFAVVGDGPLRGELEAMCRKLGLAERVVFTGHRNDVPALLRRFTVFVLPSLSEGQGITVMEAMAAGCPVVATNTGGVPELVKHGCSGLLTEPGRADQLAQAMLCLLRDPRLRQELAGQAQSSAARYGLEPMIRETAAVYRRIMAGRG